MEKMKGPLWDVIPPLLQLGATKIDIGPIAEQLLTCVEVFHKERHLLIDIKPDNFMLAYTEHGRKTKSKKKSVVVDGLAAKVRVLDLGLVCPYRTSTVGHRPDDGIAEIVGTPLYSSLNIHQRHTPSRRDDVEALGYVVAELIIRIVATARGEVAAYEGTEVPSYLPWSQEQSDVDIGKVKEKEVIDANSQFYQRMGDKATAQTMKTFFTTTQAIAFKEEPNYEKLREILSSLVVSAEISKKKPVAKKKPIAAATRSKTTRLTRSKRAATNADEEGPSPTKMRKKKQSVDEDESEFEDAAMNVDDEGDEDVYEDAKETAEEMEWEPLKENRSNPSGGIGVNVVCEEGPHEGEHFELIRGEVEALIIGKNPSSKTKPSEALWPLSEDELVDDAHVRLELRATRQVCSVKVTDLKSSSAVWVRSEKVKKGGDAQAFVNDSFTIGQSKFCVREISDSKPPRVAAKPAGKPPRNSVVRKGLSEPKPHDPAASHYELKLVVVSDGPHNGEYFGLKQSGKKVLTIGSSDVMLRSDKGIEKLHARVQLQSGKILKVGITDLSKSAGTFLNGRQTVKGKEIVGFINDHIQIGETVLEVRRG
jgi:serine/threonine protein kinase